MDRLSGCSPRRLVAAGLVALGWSVVAPSAAAAPPKACTDAYDRSQLLRKQGRLVAAQGQLQICAQASCPALIVTDCVQWLGEVQTALASKAPPLTDPSACLGAYDQAQMLRKQGKLVAARDQLRSCSQASCPGLVITDCGKWLDEVQASLPSVVPIATDGAGTNLVGVSVSVDGAAPTNSIAGRAIDLDPGPHHFTFESAGLPRVEAEVLVAIGERNKRVVVTLRKEAEAAPPPNPKRRVLRTTGLVLGAVGVAGLAVGAAFGGLTIANQNAAHCPNNLCGTGSNAGDLRTAKVDGNISTGLFIAGGALVAAGITTWLLAPSSSAPHAAFLSPVPVALPGGAGVVVDGVF